MQDLNVNCFSGAVLAFFCMWLCTCCIAFWMPLGYIVARGGHVIFNNPSKRKPVFYEFRKAKIDTKTVLGPLWGRMCV